MRTTLDLDDELIRQAQEYTGIQEKAALIHEALLHLIAIEAGKRLVALGGTMPDFKLPRRRRSAVMRRRSAMILVDSSVWIAHFRHAQPRLEAGAGP